MGDFSYVFIIFTKFYHWDNKIIDGYAEIFTKWSNILTDPFLEKLIGRKIINGCFKNLLLSTSILSDYNLNKDSQLGKKEKQDFIELIKKLEHLVDNNKDLVYYNLALLLLDMFNKKTFERLLSNNEFIKEINCSLSV